MSLSCGFSALIACTGKETSPNDRCPRQLARCLPCRFVFSCFAMLEERCTPCAKWHLRLLAFAGRDRLQHSAVRHTLRESLYNTVLRRPQRRLDFAIRGAGQRPGPGRAL